MTQPVRHPRSGPLVVATLALESVGAVLLLGSLHGATTALALVRAPSSLPSDAVVAATQVLAWSGLAVCCTWFCLVVPATARDLAVPGHGHGPVRPLVRPVLVRALVLAVAGALSPPPALAADEARTPSQSTAPSWSVLDGLPLADLPALRAPTRPPASPAALRVPAGACLWSLTERLLGPDADTAQVARSWPRLYRANRAAVGPDPDLLVVGTVLHLPPGLRQTTRPTHSEDVSR